MDELVVVAVAGQLVPGGDDGAHDLRVALGNPAEGEECTMDARGGELGEQPVHVGLDPARQRVPLGRVDEAGEGLNLEPILDIDRHRINR